MAYKQVALEKVIWNICQECQGKDSVMKQKQINNELGLHSKLWGDLAVSGLKRFTVQILCSPPPQKKL